MSLNVTPNLSFGFNDIIFLTSSFITLYILYFYYNYFTRENPLGGPFPIPIFGSIYSSSFSEFLETLPQKYGEICEIYLPVLNDRIIVVNSIEHANEFSSTSTKSPFLMRIINKEGLRDLNYEEGILFNNNLPDWHIQRQYFMKVIINNEFL